MAKQIPNYALYGDKAHPAWLDMVHFEQIHERSSLFDYEIAPHFHDGQIQLLYVKQGGGEVFIDGATWPLAPRTFQVELEAFGQASGENEQTENPSDGGRVLIATAINDIDGFCAAVAVARISIGVPSGSGLNQ